MKAETCNSSSAPEVNRLFSLVLLAFSLALPSLSGESGWKEGKQVTFDGEDLNRFVIAEVMAHPRVPGVFALAGVSRDAAGSDRGTLLIYRETPSGLERKLFLQASDSKGTFSNFKSLAWLRDGSLIAMGNHAGGVDFGGWESNAGDPIMMNAFLVRLKFDAAAESWKVTRLCDFSDEQVIALREDSNEGFWILTSKGEDGIVNFRKLKVAKDDEILQVGEFCDIGLARALDFVVGSRSRLAVIGTMEDQGVLKVFNSNGTLLASTGCFPDELFSNIAGDGNGNYYLNSRFRKIGQPEGFLLRSFSLDRFNNSYELKERWKVKADSFGSQWGTDLELTHEGDLMVSGVFKDQMRLQGNELSDGNDTTLEFDAFLSSFSSESGNLTRIRSIGRKGNDFSNAIGLSQSGVWVAGKYSETPGSPLKAYLRHYTRLADDSGNKGSKEEGEPPNSIPLLKVNLSYDGTASVCNISQTSNSGLKSDQLIYTISGGVDAEFFEIDEQQGVLRLKKDLNAENPLDFDGDNELEVMVTADDGTRKVENEVVVTVPEKLEKDKNPTYAIIDLSAGSFAPRYPVTFSDQLPVDWNGSSFKSDKILLKYMTPGSFMMGRDGNRYTEPRHRETLAEGFYIGIYEVTGSQYANVSGKDPSIHGGGLKPVESISWNEIRGTDSLKEKPAVDSFVGLLQARTSKGFDLPTEVQWEYSAGAGVSSRYSFGNEERFLDSYGWHFDNSNSTTHEVGLKLPNRWGVYDMHGNVSEFCLDRFELYAGMNRFQSLVKSEYTSGTARSFRLGSWSERAVSQTLVSRFCASPQWRSGNLGFRLVLNGEMMGNHSPVITSSGGDEFIRISIIENCKLPVLDLNASDLDGDEVFFEISGGEDAGYFNLHKKTGVLTFRNSPDYELPGDLDADNAYVVEVTASDGVISDRQVILIEVADVFENLAPSAILFEPFNLNVKSSKDKLLGFFKAKDENLEDFHAYALVAGNGGEDNSLFKVNENLLVSNGSIDLEVKSTFRIRVRVTDFEGLSHDEEICLDLNGFMQNKRLWDLGTDHGNGWRSSHWFGVYYPYLGGEGKNEAGIWIFHAELGWVYLVSSSTNSIWFWRNDLGWLWTSERSFPFLWRHDESNWTYLHNTESGPSFFFSYARNNWIVSGPD